jgi:hypothetical protein
MYGRIRLGPDSPMWGKHLPESARQKIREAAFKRPYPSEETRKKLATWKGRKHSIETKKKMSDTRKAIWADEEFKKRICATFPKAQEQRPNGLESKFMALTQSPNLKYVGNGEWWRLLPNDQRKNPDFKITGENKVVELFGNYWHRNDDPAELQDLYKQVGIDCLVIWEKEINEQPEKVKEKFNQFISGGAI